MLSILLKKWNFKLDSYSETASFSFENRKKHYTTHYGDNLCAHAAAATL